MAFFKTTDGKQLYFEDTGSGAPVLCLSGLTRNTQDFSFVAPHLSDLRLVAMDYRGRGQSEYDPDYMNYNVLRESHDAIELLDHLGIEKTAIIGTSRGGLIAMALAASHPERLSAVILNDIGPLIEPSGIAKIMEYVGKQPVSKTYDQAAQALQHMMAAQFPGVPLDRWREMAEFQNEQTEQGLTLRYDPALRTALLEQSATGAIPDMWLFFEALRDIPTGVIRGENSDILGEDALQQMHDRHPGLLSAAVPDRGHAPFLDEPEALKLIRKTLDAA